MNNRGTQMIEIKSERKKKRTPRKHQNRNPKKVENV
jgi:hypothetical protein